MSSAPTTPWIAEAMGMTVRRPAGVAKADFIQPDQRMAEANAEAVNAYWRRAGYEVNARAKFIEGRSSGGVRMESQWIVVSDLVNGVPLGTTIAQIRPLLTPKRR